MNGINLFAAFLGAVGVVLIFSVVAGAAEGILARLGGKAARRVGRWAEEKADPYPLPCFCKRDTHPLSTRWVTSTAGR
jgi:hypothetical protein